MIIFYIKTYKNDIIKLDDLHFENNSVLLKNNCYFHKIVTLPPYSEEIFDRRHKLYFALIDTEQIYILNEYKNHIFDRTIEKICKENV